VKKLLCAAGLGLALAVSAGVQAADKIAVVNVSSIFQQLPQRATVAKQLENEFKGRATELQSQERDLQTKMQRLQRDGSTMKASERSRMEKMLCLSVKLSLQKRRRLSRITAVVRWKSVTSC